MSRFTVDRENAPGVEEIMDALNDDIVEYIFDDYSLYIEFSEEGNAFVGWRLFPLEEAKNCVENAYMVQCVRDDERAIVL